MRLSLTDTIVPVESAATIGMGKDWTIERAVARACKDLWRAWEYAIARPDPTQKLPILRMVFPQVCSLKLKITKPSSTHAEKKTMLLLRRVAVHIKKHKLKNGVSVTSIKKCSSTKHNIPNPKAWKIPMAISFFFIFIIKISYLPKVFSSGLWPPGEAMSTVIDSRYRKYDSPIKHF